MFDTTPPLNYFFFFFFFKRKYTTNVEISKTKPLLYDEKMRYYPFILRFLLYKLYFFIQSLLNAQDQMPSFIEEMIEEGNWYTDN